MNHTSADSSDLLATFCEQMIPHHLNAMYMAKILLKEAPEATVKAAMEEEGLLAILQGTINNQGYQNHVFLNYLGGQGLLKTTTSPAGTREDEGLTESSAAERTMGCRFTQTIVLVFALVLHLVF